MKASILFIGKQNDFYCDRAAEFVKLHFPEHTIIRGGRTDPFPEEARWWRGDYIVSYLSPWIIPESVLLRALKASINFHPGPPEYPGIGCTNFAIYNQVSTFGVTCHYMNAKVDTGEIISVRRFPLFGTDSVFSLTQRCYAYILEQFYEIASLIYEDKELPRSEEKWQRAPYKRKELNDLCRILPDMPEEEVRRRVRAVTFPNAPGAYLEIHGMRFPYAGIEEK